MLFHTWPFLVFMLIVLPVFFALRKTRLWIPWLMVASYFFYGWWNPYYLLLVVYSTTLDYFLVALMDHCPREGKKVDVSARLARLRFDDPVLKIAFLTSTLAALGTLGMAVIGPKTLRPTMALLTLILLLMSLGALLSSRRIWLLISIVNNLALLLFFKYARFFIENLNAVLGWFHAALKLPDPSTLMPFGFTYVLPVGISFFTFQSLSYTIDFYRGLIQREPNFLRFATFVAFFPQLMAGPIERQGPPHYGFTVGRPGDSPQQRVDPGQQLARRERLCEIVIRPAIETRDLVGLRGARRQHYYGQVTQVAVALE